jgi:hypothetical protein
MFTDSFEKIAAGLKASTLDKAGLLALGVPTVYHGYKALKKGEKGEAAMSGIEGAGLGMLYRSVQKAHP